jgi:hypothetical protein
MRAVWALFVSTMIGAAWVSCGGGGDTAANGANSLGGGGSGFTSGGGTGNHHANGGGAANGGGGQGGGIVVPDGGGCVKPTCKGLNADCGDVTDTKCGGVVDCGMCPTGESCGLGGPNKCGKGSPDACAPQSCSDQMKNCGQIGDGCGNTISCGDCTSPKLCGGDPTKPNVCGCTGVCSQIPDCQPGMTTTLSGTVLDPAGKHPLYNALVYIPNDPNDAGLQPFTAGITCDVCGATAAGNPLVTTYTAADGTFALSNVPVGNNIKVVVQLGRWRRQFPINITNSCGPNPIDAGTLTMPKNRNEGDIPRIALLTGSWDAVECTLRKMGIDDGEFADPGGQEHIHFYQADDPHAAAIASAELSTNIWGRGARKSTSTPNQDILFGTTGGSPTINQYDLAILECEGYDEDQKAYWSKLGDYTAAGGRVFTSDFMFAWFSETPWCDSTHACPNAGVCQNELGFSCNTGDDCICSKKQDNPAFTGAANWNLTYSHADADEPNTLIDLVSNPKGPAFKQWLEIVGASVVNSDKVDINPWFRSTDGVAGQTQQWLYHQGTVPIHFTFNTPVGAQPADQCGRAVFSDWHAVVRDGSGSGSLFGPPPQFARNVIFPGECDAATAAMTPQEKILEFMLFDLTACVTPYKPLCTPTTCAAQGIECGPAGDGCDNTPLQCGDCPAGQFCGGGGVPGKCGMTNNCVPESCAAQGIQCGAAGDGCGNLQQCPNCPTGEVCGLGGPGKCGMLH